MRFASESSRASGLGALASALALSLMLASSAPVAGPVDVVHQQRYAMGTMFDIVAYHEPRVAAERAVAKAMEEVARLDQVLSHFKTDSDLSRLVREGRGEFVRVDPSLYEVLEGSLGYSRRSGGKFDVTIGPLLRIWKEARERGGRPSAAEIAAAQRCVGYEKIETSAPDRIRLHSDCLEIDLGAIGKGYAVDRAIAILQGAGIRNALVNAGTSSIAAIGAPPGREGWPVRLGARPSSTATLMLRDRSISTSEQNGEILDPRTGAPAESRVSVSVIAPSATVSDALDTTLLMLSTDEGAKLLAQFTGVSALWMSAAGELQFSYGTSRLRLSESR